MHSAKQIPADLHFVFSTTSPWLSFLDLPLFFATLHNPAERDGLQPALVLALLAFGALEKSNETELGQVGRARARTFLPLCIALGAYLPFSTQFGLGMPPNLPWMRR